MKYWILIFLFCTGCFSDQFADRPSQDSHISSFEKKSFFIVIDPGHGGQDKGTKLSTFYEKKITLTTAIMAKKYLEEMGYKVAMTRTRDVFVPLETRSSMANRLGANLFVSIHFNSSSNTDAKGIEIFFYDAKEEDRKKKSNLLASSILKNVIGETGAASRGVKKGNFHVIRETQMPSVLLEGGFLTNRQECKLLMKRQYLSQIAQGVAFGIDQYVSSLTAKRETKQVKKSVLGAN